MSSKKLIDRKLLKEYLNLMNRALSEMKDYDDKNILANLIQQYENIIINTDLETLNKIKKDVYMKMKVTNDPKENKELYELYCSLKELTNTTEKSKEV